jgi:hypothetical protein
MSPAAYSLQAVTPTPPPHTCDSRGLAMLTRRQVPSPTPGAAQMLPTRCRAGREVVGFVWADWTAERAKVGPLSLVVESLAATSAPRENSNRPRGLWVVHTEDPIPTGTVLAASDRPARGTTEDRPR